MPKSKLETECMKWLQCLSSNPKFTLKNIQFNQTLHIPKKPLRADFCGIHETFSENEMKISFWIIELDGSQHFDAANHFHIKHALKKQKNGNLEYSPWDALQESQTRDLIKHMWCLENQIHICRIPYNESARMHEYLFDFFSKICTTNKVISYLVNVEKYHYLT